MHLTPRILVSCTLLLAAVAAQASDFFCNNYVANSPPPHFQCVQTTVGPGAPSLIAPDDAGSGLRFAASTSAEGGPFAGTASASATASPGLLRGFASAQTLGGIDGSQAVARSDAWFADGGTVVGAAGVAAGTPVKLRFTIDVAGGFAGGGIFTALSEANVDLFTRGPSGYFAETRATINKFNPFGFETTDVDALVGDTFEMLMKLHVAAGAIVNSDSANTMSVADVSNTSHLYVDVLSGNADFIGADGHAYATAAVTAVPEPAEYALLLSGLLVTGVFVRRRSATRVR